MEFFGSDDAVILRENDYVVIGRDGERRFGPESAEACALFRQAALDVYAWRYNSIGSATRLISQMPPDPNEDWGMVIHHHELVLIAKILGLDPLVVVGTPGQWDGVEPEWAQRFLRRLFVLRDASTRPVRGEEIWQHYMDLRDRANRAAP